MGFNWDDYKGGGSYISAAEKQVLVESGIPIGVTGVRGPIEKGFEKPQYEVDVIVPNPETGEDEDRVLSFAVGSGAASRDRMLHGLQGYFAEGGDPVTAKVVKVGRAFFLEQA